MHLNSAVFSSQALSPRAAYAGTAESEATVKASKPIVDLWFRGDLPLLVTAVAGTTPGHHSAERQVALAAALPKVLVRLKSEIDAGGAP